MIVIKHPMIINIIGRYDPNISFENKSSKIGTLHIFKKDYGSSFIFSTKICYI